MLFADRLEVWNPGELPPPLTLERLRRPHPSIPHNPLIADPLFLTRYIEKAGTGTLDMIARLREAGLPEPEFRQDGGTFVQALWRDWLTPKALASLGLSERQKSVIDFVRANGRIGNADFQRLAKVTKATATRDLEVLTKAGVLRKVGRTGKGTYYTLSGKGLRGLIQPRDRKGLAKGSNGSTGVQSAQWERVQEKDQGVMSEELRGGGIIKPVFVDNRDGNTLARAITTHLAALRRDGRTPVELCVASCYFNPQGLELIASEARHVPHIRLLLGADPTPEALLPRARGASSRSTTRAT